MKSILIFLILVFFIHFSYAQEKKASEVFITKPYLQIGRFPGPDNLQLLWHSNDTDQKWSIETKSAKNGKWRKTESPSFKIIAVKGVQKHRVYNVSLNNLTPGSIFIYRIKINNKEVFNSEAHAPKAKGQEYSFVAFGDCGAGTVAQKPLAKRTMIINPDFVVITGDIVYDKGLASEYMTKFWPIYNSDKNSETGAPLMRSIPFFSAPGNHDTDTRDLNKYPDALAYYYYWNQPLNGPLGTEGGAFVPPLMGSDSNRIAFIAGAGEAYPKMTNYSFDYNNAHWTIVDSNPYVDWTDKDLREWLANDLALAKDAEWKFVVFHHPGFNSSIEHYEQQQMRLIAPILEAGKVDVVFNGHVHNYQRSFPVKFLPDKQGTLLIGGKDGKTIRGRVVNGRWKLDKTYDGKTDTTPEGIIYIVTGAGGQRLYNPEQNNDPDSWQKFTDKFISNTHSLTVADVKERTMTIKQLDSEGNQLDHFIITK